MMRGNSVVEPRVDTDPVYTPGVIDHRGTCFACSQVVHLEALRVDAVDQEVRLFPEPRQ